MKSGGELVLVWGQVRADAGRCVLCIAEKGKDDVSRLLLLCPMEQAPLHDGKQRRTETWRWEVKRV